MSLEELSQWKLSALDNVKVAKDMFELGHYNWCLFIWHLAVEKALKAKLASLDKEIPYTHDLKKLFLLCGFSEHAEGFDVNDLVEITTFNLEARYDDYKLEFYKKATKEYTELWSKKAQLVFDLVLRDL